MDDDTIDPQFMMQNSAVDPLAFPDMFDNYHDPGLNAVSKTDDDDEEMEDLFGDDTVAAQGQGQSASNLAASASATASNADESGEERERCVAFLLFFRRSRLMMFIVSSLFVHEGLRLPQDQPMIQMIFQRRSDNTVKILSMKRTRTLKTRLSS